MSKMRIAMVGLAAVLMLAWAVPAFAQNGRAAATITVTEGKPTIFAIGLAPKTVKHGTVVFNVMNKGSIPHDFKINGKKTANINPGKSAKLTVTFAKAGSYKYECTVPGHAGAGMKGTLKVT